jgi:catechol 2,3-dioxygenase-like lactoylglutathione lyase family enzyme
MGFHHVAIATRDVAANHDFYTRAMGFELVKVEAINTPNGGWARHFFYDTHGQGLLAFWDVHDEAEVPDEYNPALSRGLGLPPWVNHLAFDAGDLDGLAVHRQRLLDYGLGVAEIDHGWCTSIYVEDPNGTMVEFCATTRAFTDADKADAGRLLAATGKPADIVPDPPVTIHEPDKEPAVTG